MKQYPLIGITTYGRDENGRFSLPGNYVDAVRRAGGIPLFLPHGEPHTPELITRLDGFIISGGGDIDPERYQGRHHETIYMIDAERDSSELELVRRLVDLKLPLLNICRGIQALNVALGGTLIEHLPDEIGDEIAHRVPPRNPTTHPIQIESFSQLAQIIGQTNVSPTSWHHQALRNVAPGLEVVAYAPDGVIEAVEMPDHPWLIGVQWHPEMTAADDPGQQRLFDALVTAAGEYKTKHNKE